MIHAQVTLPHQAGLALVRPLLPAHIALATTDPRSAHHRVLPQESAAMARAVPGRQRAFAAGRAAAHLAMRDLGHIVQPVVMGADRAPIWPAGLVGSLSHSQTCCIAALAHHDTTRAIGIDVEEDTGLDIDLADTVCTLAERKWLSQQPVVRAGQLAKMIFSAKECAYKCQYTLTRTLFGFDTFEIMPDLDAGTFTATFTQDIDPFTAGTVLSGRLAIGDGLIVTAMAIAA